MIINTGMRTDIPAFYSEWLLNRIREGYANTNPELVKGNMKRHDPKSLFLLGHSEPGDVVRESEQKSWIDHQMRLTDI